MGKEILLDEEEDFFFGGPMRKKTKTQFFCNERLDEVRHQS